MIHLAHPWALLALASIPTILVLHSLRPRRPKVVLSTTSMWREALRERQRGLGLQKLLKDLSLLLLLLFALLTSIGLADPRWLTRTTERSDVVLVLDVSASMKARSDSGLTTGSRFAAAKRQAARIIDTLPEDGRLLIMTSGRAPVLRSGFETDRQRLHRQLEAVRPTDESGQPRSALELALALLRNREQGRVYFLTDGAFDESVDFKTPQIEYRLIGGPSRNVAITRFDFRPEVGAEDRFQMLLTLRNYTEETLNVPVTVTLDGTRLMEQTVELALEEKKTLVMPFRGLAAGRAHARIDVDDDLEGDNEAFAVIATDERLRVLLFSKGNFYLESVFEAMPNVSVTRLDALQADEYPDHARLNDIVVFDGIAPPRLGAGSFLLIDAIAPDMPLSEVGTVLQPSIVGRGESALVRQLDLSGLKIDKAKRVVVESRAPGLQRLFWSNETDLALALLQHDTRLVFVGFNLFDTNFPLQTAFPLFLSESLAWLRPRENRHKRTQTRAGETFVIDLPVQQPDLIVRTPSGEGLIYEAKQGRVLFNATSESGIYQYRHAGVPRYFAVNLTEEHESDIRPRAYLPEKHDGPVETDADSQLTITLWPYLMGLALVVLALEWGVWCWRPGRA